jgi:hypothetical protein
LLKKQKQGNIYICWYGIFGGGGTVHEVKKSLILALAGFDKLTHFRVGWVVSYSNYIFYFFNIK